ncbi:MAG: aminomethyl-transferring glycine dehydrogenase subunit GcvPA [Pseudomonadota bacterium]
MKYIPNSKSEVIEMLAEIGQGSIENLFNVIPEAVKIDKLNSLPRAHSEHEVIEYFEKLGAENETCSKNISYLGAGAYDHYIPAIVDDMIRRSEFTTVYTPYQAEISQGTLQTIFEFQTMISRLTGMDCSNASVYDGASALAESALMAQRITRKNKIIVCKNVHPNYRAVLNTYLNHQENSIVEYDFSMETSCTVFDDLDKTIKENKACAAIVIQNPNFFGAIEDIKKVSDIAHENGALLIVTLNEALSLALIKSPGELGADIVAGEAQSFACSLSYGGPFLGFIATRDKFLRNLPGRIAGQTVDSEGKPGFVLTLCTREQHIRREKSISNICSNQALCALAATIYLSTMGSTGLYQLAKLNFNKAHNLRKELLEIKVGTAFFNSFFFNEFVLKIPNLKNLRNKLIKENIHLGVELEKFYPEMSDLVLLCATEKLDDSKLNKTIETIVRNT